MRTVNPRPLYAVGEGRVRVLLRCGVDRRCVKNPHPNLLPLSTSGEGARSQHAILLGHWTLVIPARWSLVIPLPVLRSFGITLLRCPLFCPGRNRAYAH